ncbi:hypothetical protein CONPUDRAFT_170260 [Coniophora puteana RWD-64-598 SS2]|uniref:F-box domain-containing protein n=1 Tax=Coniophora puteana (strain RWD-64-598) TaxID=741705 RepID=R7SDL0_CONPW|nr:uncharacterized protein CONPUDRAFT_170260 [Coniophora puteana RWD-64-598 SS2]EIW74248.1 hypothetical protein CONPUDRAFT_170260 [Coniophora puteana RWD-64-598 SS2]
MSLKAILNLLDDITSEVERFNEGKWEILSETNLPVILDQEIVDVRHNLARFSDMITDIDTIVGSLLDCRWKLESHRLGHSRSISAVIRLPAEILSDIFVRSTAIEVDFSRSRSRIPPLHETISPGRSVSVSLAQVCRRWREIALSTPQIWNFIAPFDRHDALCGGTLPHFDELVARSGSAPLHLFCKPGEAQQLIELFDVISVNGPRSRTIGLVIDANELESDQWLDDDVDSWIASFPNLRRLTLNRLDEFPTQVVSRIYHLTHLDIQGAYATEFVEVIGMHWEYLECLVVNGGSMEGITWNSLSARIPQLKELYVQAYSTGRADSGDEEDDDPSSNEVVYPIHPRLQVLSLSDVYQDTPKHIDLTQFDRAFPVLSHLALTWSRMQDIREGLSGALERRTRPMQSLAICYGMYPPSLTQESALLRLGEQYNIESVEYVPRWHNWSVYADTMEKWYSPHVARHPGLR